MPKFDAPGIWQRWLSPSRDLTLFMAVPTIYSRLIEIYNGMSASEQAKASESCSQFRLQVSGSAPLPSPLKEKWKTISGGQVLLERYGMTETGMIISCGMAHHERVDGHVGLPMPGQHVRLWDAEQGKDVSDQQETAGEIQVKGDLVFKGYWKLPEKTKEEFTEDGWFKTGDIGVRTEGTSYYRIQGRSSTDISTSPFFTRRAMPASRTDRFCMCSVKSGGEKCSALEVERALLSLDYIKDAAVVGVEDPRWGEVVACVLVLDTSKKPTLELKELRDTLREELANYKIPQKMKICESAMTIVWLYSSYPSYGADESGPRLFCRFPYADPDEIPRYVHDRHKWRLQRASTELTVFLIYRNAMGKVAKKQLVKEAFPSA